MASENNAPVQSPVTIAWQDAMTRLAAGDLAAAVPAMLAIHEQHPDREEAFFAEEHLARIRKQWPAEAEKAGLTAETWAAVQRRAVERRSGKVPVGQDFVPIVTLVIAAAWSFLMVAAPNAALLGRGPEVPLIFRLVALVVGAISAGTAFGLMKLKWEAVNVFIILSPVFMIVTFIGFTESGDVLGKVLCA